VILRLNDHLILGAYPSAMEPRVVLFVCTHNSARSQMAEGMVRAWGGERFQPFSAGTEPRSVRPEAIEVMREIGIDIGEHTSKHVGEFLSRPVHWVITVCDDARQNCPIFPGADQTAHWSIPDPSAVEGDRETRLDAFRQARDDLRNRIHMFLLAAGRDDLPAPEPRSLTQA
jgi:arsenate reductase (thioredoxin)